MGQNKARFGLTMSPDLLKQIDKDRGLIARATYIEFSMKKYFELKNFIDEEIKFYEEIKQDLLSKSNASNKLTPIIAKISKRQEQLIKE